MIPNPAQRAAAKLDQRPGGAAHSVSTITRVIADRAKDGAKALVNAGLAVIQQPQNDFMDQDVRDLITPLKTQLHRTDATVKLEQMARGSIIFALSWLYVSSFLCLVAAIIVAAIASSPDVSTATVNASLLIEGICRTLAVIMVTFLFIFFTFRVIRFHSVSRMPLQQEQVLLISFLFLLMLTPGMSIYSPVLYWNQYTTAQINGPLLYESNQFNFSLSEAILVSFFTQQEGNRISAVMITSVCTVLVISFGILYFGLTCYYFGIASVTAEQRNVLLHVEVLRMLKRMALKSHRGIIACSLAYTILFIPLVRVYNFLPSQVPLVGMISVLKSCTLEYGFCSPSAYNSLGFQRAMVVSTQFVCECFVFWYLHRVANTTSTNLKSIPYASSRAKHLGFKFFNSYKRMMYFFVLLGSIIVVASSGKVIENFDAQLDANGESRGGVAVNPLKQVGITFFSMGFGSFYLLLASFLFSFAYAYLPPDSHNGLWGFFRGGVKRTDVDPSPVYLAQVSDVRFLREAKLRMRIEEQEAQHGSQELPTPFAARLRTFQNDLSSKLPKPNKNIADGLQRFAELLHLDHFNSAGNGPEATVNNDEEEGLERRLFGASDACYQVNANFFCLETEVLMLNLAFLAYLQDEAVKRSLPEKYRLVAKIDNVDTEIQCYVACTEHMDEILVFFRGTSTTTNVWQDLNYFQMPPQMRAEDVEPVFDPLDLFQQASATRQRPMVHRGFYRAYLSIQLQLMECVSKLIDSKDTSNGLVLFCSGHSLGGALATHFAADIGLKYRTLQSKVWGIQLSTFGSPRVGNFAYTSRVTRLVSTIHRFCVGGDPVPKLPPSQYFGSLTYYGFQHVGVEILLDVEKINLLIEPLFIEKQIQHAWRGYVPAHHAMSSYVLSILFWNARVHPDFVPDWWLPVVNSVLQAERERINTVKTMYPKLNPSIVDQLEKEGAVYWTADLRSFQNRGCDTSPIVEVSMIDEAVGTSMNNDEEEEELDLV